MKVSDHKLNETNTENMQAGPKLRNIHEEKDIPEEIPEGADMRLKLCVVAIAVFILIVGIKGAITKSSLSAQLEEQNKLLTAAQAEALLYGITEDEDGDLVLPITDTDISVDVSELDWDSVEQRNTELLSSFTSLLLNWEGQNGYENVRQKLINDWEFTEDSKLLSSFMPPMDEELNANMSLSGYSTFVLSNDGKNMSYFLICTVRNTINRTSATGTVGIRITINEDGTVSNVTAQTLS